MSGVLNNSPYRNIFEPEITKILNNKFGSNGYKVNDIAKGDKEHEFILKIWTSQGFKIIIIDFVFRSSNQSSIKNVQGYGETSNTPTLLNINPVTTTMGSEITITGTNLVTDDTKINTLIIVTLVLYPLASALPKVVSKDDLVSV